MYFITLLKYTVIQMDYSELFNVLKTEADAIKANALDFFKFVNHFYGCISILEMLGEHELDSLVDISNITFENIGSHHGFYTSEYSLAYKPYTDIYESIWQSIWKNIGEKHDTSIIDKLEDEVFSIVLAFEKVRGLSFFKCALSQQSLTAEQNTLLQDLLAEEHLAFVKKSQEENKLPENLALPEEKSEANTSGNKDITGIKMPVVDYKIMPEKVRKYRRTRRHNNISPMSSQRMTAITHKKKRLATH